MPNGNVDRGAPPDYRRERISERSAGCREARLEPLIPKASPGGRPRKTDMRAAMNAILYLLRSFAANAVRLQLHALA
jgi:hypothetical protein